MRRQISPGALALGSVLVLTATCYALRAIPVGPIQLPAPQQVARADAVVLGKVESIADKTVKAKSHIPGQNTEVEYQVATVKVQDGFLGAKGLTDVQIAWVPGAPNVNPRFRGRQVNLTKDQEACFFLTKHPTEAFFVVNSTPDVVNKSNADFEKYTTLVKKCVQALDDPQKGLKSKEAAERLLTANLLLTRYRQPAFGSTKQESIDADESKLILQTMLDADWTKVDADTGTNPQAMFYMINPTKEEGWQPPQNITQPNQIIDAMKGWVKDNVSTYRIKKFVPEKTDK
jgi:hypothetical protein